MDEIKIRKTVREAYGVIAESKGSLLPSIREKEVTGERFGDCI